MTNSTRPRNSLTEPDVRHMSVKALAKGGVAGGGHV
jgi:hypothetical protein